MASLSAQLSNLETTGLIRLAAAQPELEYLFRHALVQDAAYGSLVKTDRRGLHRAAGEALERLYPDRLDSLEIAPILGRHFAEAGDDERALRYLRRAGEAASRVYAIPEAIAHYTAALAAAHRLGGKVTSDEWISLYTGLGIAYELNARYSEAIELYGELEALAQQKSDRTVRLAAIMAQAKIYSTLNPVYDPPRARALLEEALALARDGSEAADRALEARVLWNLMLLETFAGEDMLRARDLGEASLRLARELDLREQMAYTLNDLQYAYNYTDSPDRADAALDESRALWIELGNLVMLADNLSNKSIRQVLRGKFEQAIATGKEALQITQTIGNLWGQATSEFFLGHAYVELGQPGNAFEVFEAACRLGEQTGHSAVLIVTNAGLAEVLASLGALEPAFDRARRSVAATASFDLWRPWALAVLARLYILRGDLAEAEVEVKEARQGLRPGSAAFLSPHRVLLAEMELELARGCYEEALSIYDELAEFLRAFGSPALEPEALLLKGRALWEMGRQNEAHAAWQTARSAAEAMGSRHRLWPVLAALSRAEAEQGHVAEAQALRRQAQAIVQYIAEQTGSAELRASFLALEPVRSLMLGEDS